jgi:hypothetical protein
MHTFRSLRRALLSVPLVWLTIGGCEDGQTTAPPSVPQFSTAAAAPADLLILVNPGGAFPETGF